MLTSFARFTVYLALASSVLGAAIPAATVTAMSTEATTSGTLWKNNVHDKVYSSEAPAAILTTEGNISNTLCCKLLLTNILLHSSSTVRGTLEGERT